MNTELLLVFILPRWLLRIQVTFQVAVLLRWKLSTFRVLRVPIVVVYHHRIWPAFGDSPGPLRDITTSHPDKNPTGQVQVYNP